MTDLPKLPESALQILTPNSLTLEQLEERFPYMFAGYNLGVAIPQGWMKDFHLLCEQIDAALGKNKRGFHWGQCKEKFGSARWYWHMKGGIRPIRIDIISESGVLEATLKSKKSKTPKPSVSEQVRDLICAAEAKTEHTCIVCGAPGEIDDMGRYLLVLCPEHVRLRHAEQLPEFWL